MLFLATSCLQGRPQLQALTALAALSPEGFQLTPGHHPSTGFRAIAESLRVEWRYHHGFAWDRYAQPVYDADGEPVVDMRDRSVHPPSSGRGDLEGWLGRRAARSDSVEIMTPGRWLGDGESIALAMSLGVPLAVDVSHLHIQRRAGTISERQIARLLEYDRIEEVHVSDNDGRSDQHRPISEATFGLEWARERMRAGTPVVLECYMHGLDLDERRRQRDILRC